MATRWQNQIQQHVYAIPDPSAPEKGNKRFFSHRDFPQKNSQNFLEVRFNNNNKKAMEME